MSLVLVAVLVLLYTFQSAFANLFAKYYPGEKKNSSAVYSVFYGVIVALATLIFARFRFAPSSATLILGAVNGAILVVYNTMLIRASALGPFSITMIFNLSGGILIPLFWSVLHDGERLSVGQYVAIAVMLVAFVFLNWEEKKPGEEKQKISLRFLAVCLLLGLANGIYGTLLSAQKNLAGEGESAEMIIMTFGTSAILAFIVLLIQSGKEALPGFRQNTGSALSLLAASVSAASAVNLLMYCLTLINVAVLYTLDNGGVLIVSVLWSMVILKEKLGLHKIIGLILSILAVFALSIL